MPDHPEIGRFDDDPRVHIDKLSGRYQYEDDESGQEFEWSEVGKAWFPIVSEPQSNELLEGTLNCTFRLTKIK